ncbi:hypothetical protein OJ998_15665 [Solirubrobacter taibaiensis]|nr:hypothetical protein [Solirubrobacter taibaiensis]
MAAAVVVYLIKSPLASGIKFAETRKAVGDFCTVLDLDPTANPAGPIVPKTSRSASPAGLPIWLAVDETGTAHTST